MKTLFLLLLTAASALAAPFDLHGLNQTQGDGTIKPIAIGGVLPNEVIATNALGVPVSRSLTALDMTPGQFFYYDPRLYPLTAFTLRNSLTLPATPFIDGISGCTYNPRTGTLFLVRNVSAGGGNIFEITTDGTLIRNITLTNFTDTEELTWMGWDAAVASDIFMISEENLGGARDSNLSLIKITNAATTIDRLTANNVTTTTAYSGGNLLNVGLEAMAYDPIRGVIYYTAEERTSAVANNQTGSAVARIFTRPVTLTTPMSFGTETVLCDISALYTAGPLIQDISGMCFDPLSDTILFTAEKNITDKVVRINRAGAMLEQLSITTGQAEGVCLHPRGTELYVTSEPLTYNRYSLGWHPVSSRTGVRRTIHVGAAAMVPRTTNGAAPGSTETATNKIMVETLDFDQTIEEGAGFWLTLPRAWDLGPVTATFQWTATTGTGNVKWDIAARAFPANSLLDQALGTEQTTGVVTGTTANAGQLTAATPALTIAGTLAHGLATYWQVTRDTATDTMAADAKLLGVTIQYTESTTEPSSQ